MSRTNNPLEHRFGSTKRGLRRRVGAKKLTRLMQAMRPEALLVSNLDHQDFLDLVLDGSVANLPAMIAKHWRLAVTIRQQRLAPTADHPFPTTKQQIRTPRLLKTIKQTIAAAVLQPP